MWVEVLPFLIKAFGILLPWGLVAWKFKNITNPRGGVEAAIYVLLACIATMVIWIMSDAVGDIVASA